MMKQLHYPSVMNIVDGHHLSLPVLEFKFLHNLYTSLGSSLNWKKPPIIVLFNIWDSKNHLGGGLQMFFELQKQRNNSWGFDLLWVLKCLLTSLSTLVEGYILNPVLWIFDNWWVSEHIPKLTMGGLIQRISPCYYLPLHLFGKN
jgi:hypothetical protein